MMPSVCLPCLEIEFEKSGKVWLEYHLVEKSPLLWSIGFMCKRGKGAARVSRVTEPFASATPEKPQESRPV
jgi:hypothetical protein